jgi:hypothetical protein
VFREYFLLNGVICVTKCAIVGVNTEFTQSKIKVGMCLLREIQETMENILVDQPQGSCGICSDLGSGHWLASPLSGGQTCTLVANGRSPHTNLRLGRIPFDGHAYGFWISKWRNT